MTTTVTIDAHCADTKQVVIVINDGNEEKERILQDGESESIHLHEPDQSVTVTEADKG